VDPRLPDATRRRHQRNARRRTDLVGIVLVVAAATGSARWVADYTHFDLSGMATAPSALGFTMWAPHPSHTHPGAAAPSFAQPADAPTCSPEYPTFVLGMADLKHRIGPLMGDPLECESPVDADGDTRQRTTTGLAEYAERTHTVTFSDGPRHWAMSGDSLVDWMDQAGYTSERQAH
jgi:hypothetical protein